MNTLYRMELSPQLQQQAQQQMQQQTGGAPLPMQRPPEPQQPQQQASQYIDTYSMEKPKPDIRERMLSSLNNKVQGLGQNRFTNRMQERVSQFANGLRQSVENGEMTMEEAKQVLSGSVGEEFGMMNRWVKGEAGPSSWRETKDPKFTRKYLLDNKQGFEELSKLSSEIESTKAKLESVYDKKNPKFARAMQALGQKTAKRDELQERLRMGLQGGEAIKGSIDMHKARGEAV